MPPYTYAEINALRPTVLTLLEDLKRARPDAWATAHRAPAPAGDLFARLAARAGQLAGIRVGVNGKRGNLGDFSQDCLAFPVVSGGAPDASGRFPGVVIIDFIAGAGGASPELAWIDQTGPTIAAGTRGGFVDPVVSEAELGSGTVTPPPPQPPPTPRPCQYSPTDLTPVLAALEHWATGLAQGIREEQEATRAAVAAAAQSTAEEAARQVITWLQSNRVRVRF